MECSKLVNVAISLDWSIGERYVGNVWKLLLYFRLVSQFCFSRNAHEDNFIAVIVIFARNSIEALLK